MVQHASIQVDFKGNGSNLSSRVVLGVCNFFEKEVSTPIFVMPRVMYSISETQYVGFLVTLPYASCRDLMKSVHKS
jgi:hypothetical protein